MKVLVSQLWRKIKAETSPNPVNSEKIGTWHLKKKNLKQPFKDNSNEALQKKIMNPKMS